MDGKGVIVPEWIDLDGEDVRIDAQDEEGGGLRGDSSHLLLQSVPSPTDHDGRRCLPAQTGPRDPNRSDRGSATRSEDRSILSVRRQTHVTHLMILPKGETQ